MTRTPSYTSVGLWGPATAVGAALAWPLAAGVAWLLIGHFPEPIGASVTRLSLLGGGFGAAVALVAAPLLLRPRIPATLFWVPALAVSGAVGSAATGLVTRAAGTSMPSLVSASLGFGLGGAVAGLEGFVWARRYPQLVPQVTGFTDTDDDSAQLAPVAATTVAARGRIGWLGLARLVPLTATAACSTALAVRVGESDSVAGVLLGVFGLSVTLTLCDHEERLRRLEAGHPGDRPDAGVTR